MTELKIGSTLQNGKYEITKVLGSGNFGITYLATTRISVNGLLGQMDVAVNVAIKEFYMKDLNNRTSDGSTVEGTQNTMVKNYRKKFKKEAENLAKLHHPNIVKVIEVFDENNTTYYVMEYVEGGSLDDYILSKGRLTEEEALSPHNKESYDEYYNSLSTLYVDSVCYSRSGMISGSEYDIAHKIWGNNWCIPTKEQVNELINQCEWKWGSYKGCNGMIGKGPNGNLIFFPATGYSNENGIWYKNNEGDYWCGDLCNPSKHDHSNYDPAVIEDSGNYRRANCYSFSKTDDISSGCTQRYLGYAVRPIKSKQ